MRDQTFPITLVESYFISPKVKHFVFSAELDPAFHYIAGQFITIHFSKDDRNYKRSYSIANSAQQDNRIEFAASYVENGPGSDLLFNLKPQESINITGPFGRLLLKEEAIKRYILVATSTGVTPYRAMLEELAKRLEQNKELEIVILEGVQKQEDLLYGDDFLKFSHHYPGRVIFRAQFSQLPKETELQAYEHRGYVQTAFQELHLRPSDDFVYLCGNPAMIDDSFTYLKNQGFAMTQIIREKYISSPSK